MWRNHMGGQYGWIGLLVLVVVVVALAAVGALAWLIIDLARREAHTHPPVSDHAEAILAQRYARGEIDANRYWQLLGDIRRGRR